MTKFNIAHLSKLRTIIIGAPGSGKGTICHRIVENFNFNHISSGDILRSHITRQTDLGKSVATYLSGGKLVPDDIMNDLIKTELEKTKEPWILDGYPRTEKQAEKLSNSVDINLVLHLNVPNEVIIGRLKNRLIHSPSGRIYNLGFNDPKTPGLDDITNDPLEQREDDKPETVRKRLEIYDETITPVLKFYESRNLVTAFRGNTTKEIWKNLSQFLDDRSKIKETS